MPPGAACCCRAGLRPRQHGWTCEGLGAPDQAWRRGGLACGARSPHALVRQNGLRAPVGLIPGFIPVPAYLDEVSLRPPAVPLAVRLVPPPLTAAFRAGAAAREGPPGTSRSERLPRLEWAGSYWLRRSQVGRSGGSQMQRKKDVPDDAAGGCHRFPASDSRGAGLPEESVRPCIRVWLARPVHDGRSRRPAHVRPGFP